MAPSIVDCVENYQNEQCGKILRSVDNRRKNSTKTDNNSSKHRSLNFDYFRFRSPKVFSASTLFISLIIVGKLEIVNSAALVCVHDKTNAKSTICFDITKERASVIVPPETFNEINEYNVANQAVAIANALRLKPKACRGFNFYRRCAKKSATESERFECRYDKCRACVAESYLQHCPFCAHEKSTFCPAVEACTCPWKAGFGVWESCRRKASTNCGFVQNGYPIANRKRPMHHRIHSHHHRHGHQLHEQQKLFNKQSHIEDKNRIVVNKIENKNNY